MSKSKRLDLEECTWCNFPIVDCRCHYRECKAYLSRINCVDRDGVEYWQYDENNCNCEEIEQKKEEQEKIKDQWGSK